MDQNKIAAARLLPSVITARALDPAEAGEIDPAGPPPSDPLQVSEWFSLNLVDDVHRQITGQADENISKEWPQASHASVKVWPPDLMIEARRMLQDSLGDDRGRPKPVCGQSRPQRKHQTFRETAWVLVRSRT